MGFLVAFISFLGFSSLLTGLFLRSYALRHSQISSPAHTAGKLLPAIGAFLILTAAMLILVMVS